MTDHLKPTTESGIKRLAKQLKSERGISHAQALDAAARQAGFSNYRHASKATKPVIDELEQAVRQALGHGFIEIVDLVSASDRSHWYAAVKDEGRVSAYVVITELTSDNTYRIKPIHEGSGPFGFEAPMTFIAKLSATTNRLLK